MQIIESFGHLIGTTARLMKYSMQQHLHKSGIDITMEQFIILHKLLLSDGMNQKELASCFSKDKGSITRIIDTMEKGNLVVRIPDKQDKRSKLIYLTPYGKTINEQMRQEVLGFQLEMIQDIPIEDLETCKKVLGSIVSKLTSDEVVDTTKIKLKKEN